MFKRRFLFASMLVLFSGTLAISGPVEDFRTADVNGDELLSAAEFRAFINLRADNGSKVAKRVRAFGAYGIALNRVDYNKDKIVSPDELRRYDRENP